MKSLITEVAAPTIITEGSNIQGNLTFLSNTQIYGLVEGDVHQQSLEPVCIGRTGWVKGSVHARGPVLVEGRVEGNITSSTKIRLSPTAQVQGTLSAPSVEMRPGALFEGEFRMKISRAKLQPTKRAA